MLSFTYNNFLLFKKNFWKNPLRYLIQLIGGMLSVLTMLFLKFKLSFVLVTGILIVYMITFVLNIRSIKIDDKCDQAHKNKILFFYAGLSEIGILAGLYIERFFDGITLKSYCFSAILIAVTFICHCFYMAGDFADNIFQKYALLSYVLLRRNAGDPPGFQAGRLPAMHSVGTDCAGGFPVSYQGYSENPRQAAEPDLHQSNRRWFSGTDRLRNICADCSD